MLTTLSKIPVGSVVKLNLDGSPTNFLVVHQGKPSDLYDDSCTGTWLLLQDIYAKLMWDETNNDYKNSDIHAWLNSTFLSLLDQNIQQEVIQVKVPYYNGIGGSGEDVFGANGLSCKIFLLSSLELGWTPEDFSYVSQNGSKLDYFLTGDDDAARSRRIASYKGANSNWWTRSVHNDAVKPAFSVGSSGSDGGFYVNSTVVGVRPALVLPDMLVDDGTIIVRSKDGLKLLPCIKY